MTQAKPRPSSSPPAPPAPAAAPPRQAEHPAPAPRPPRPEASPPVAPAPTERDRPPIRDASGLWARVLELGAGRPATEALLDQIALAAFDGSTASLRVLESKHLSFAKGRSSQLEALFEQAAGERIRIEFVESADKVEDTPAREAPGAAARAEASKHPVVGRAMDLFDARVVDIEDDPGAAG